MPCICYGATSGKEDYDGFLASEKGKKINNPFTTPLQPIVEFWKNIAA